MTWQTRSRRKSGRTKSSSDWVSGMTNQSATELQSSTFNQQTVSACVIEAAGREKSFYIELCQLRAKHRTTHMLILTGWLIITLTCWIMSMETQGTWWRGWPRKSWQNCVRKSSCLSSSDAQDTDDWNQPAYAGLPGKWPLKLFV